MGMVTKATGITPAATSGVHGFAAGEAATEGGDSLSDYGGRR